MSVCYYTYSSVGCAGVQPLHATQSTADIDSQSKRVRPPFDGDKLASTFLLKVRLTAELYRCCAKAFNMHGNLRHFERLKGDFLSIN